MSAVAALNQRFGRERQLEFKRDASGLVIMEIENPLASARLCLQGAHLLTWRPRATSIPVVWLSEEARLSACRSVHSGAPICWPWFGAHPEQAHFPAHGFARNVPWEVVAAEGTAEGATQVTLRLLESEQTRAYWPHASALQLSLTVGETLQMALTTVNAGAEAFRISEAYHTYFYVSDIAKVRVRGLAGATYLDKVEHFARKQLAGDLRFEGETDHVYVDSTAECAIEDEALGRRIRIAKSGSQTTVVWTPWQEKAGCFDDIGAEDWRHMLCVESANAAHNALDLAPGASHTLAVEYRVEPM